MITITTLSGIFMLIGSILLIRYSSEIKFWFRELRYRFKMPQMKMPRFSIPSILIPSPAFSFIVAVGFGFTMFMRSTEVKPCPKHPVAMMIFAPKAQLQPKVQKAKSDTTKMVADCGCN
jgi:hypothetical protein